MYVRIPKPLNPNRNLRQRWLAIKVYLILYRRWWFAGNNARANAICKALNKLWESFTPAMQTYVQAQPDP